MNIMQMRRGMGASGSEPLPYDAEIEYLETDGYAYIDIGIGTTGAEKFNIKALMNSTSVWTFGRRVNTSSYQFGLLQPGNQVGYTQIRIGNNTIISLHTSNKLFELELSRTQYTYKTEDDLFSGDFSGFSDYELSLFLFNCNNNGAPLTTGNSGIRIYNFSMHGTGRAIIDLVPVRVGQVGYMYDKVRRLLFGNAGTGSFILGPDVQ